MSHHSSSVSDLTVKTMFCCCGKPKAVVLNGPRSPLSQVGSAGNEQAASSTPVSSPWPWFAWKKRAMCRQRNQGQQLARVAVMPGCRRTKERQVTLKKLYEDAVSLSSKLPDIQTLWTLVFQTQAPISKPPWSMIFFRRESGTVGKKKNGPRILGSFSLIPHKLTQTLINETRDSSHYYSSFSLLCLKIGSALIFIINLQLLLKPYSLRTPAAQVDKKQFPLVHLQYLSFLNLGSIGKPAILPVSKADLLLSQKETQHS